jgi:hypothetical protein
MTELVTALLIVATSLAGAASGVHRPSVPFAEDVSRRRRSELFSSIASCTDELMTTRRVVIFIATT